ncbi:MAG TPA: hypothetical protein ACHBZ9_04505 [Arsenophonus nasoniae]|uniref:hypothetical protein n=1 Tax=Arsenophonus nasoniae TaxID=638 RepID=UPI00387A72FC
MGILPELDNLLEKIPLWKKIKSVPTEVEDLKRRVTELEKIINSQPGDKCPKFL